MTDVTNLLPYRHPGLGILDEKEIAVFDAVESRSAIPYWAGPHTHGYIRSDGGNQPTRQNQKL